jgi:hypothetical protein
VLGPHSDALRRRARVHRRRLGRNGLRWGRWGSDTLAAKRTINHEAQRQAKAINLRLSDFPNGWRASTPSSKDEANNEKTRKCFGVDYSKLTLIGDASSKDFAQGENATASSEAQITKTEADAKAGLQKLATGLEGDKPKDCLRKAIGSTPGYKVGDIDIGELRTTKPSGVDEARAWEIVIPIEVTSGAGKGLSVSAYADAVFLRKGNVVAQVSTGDVLSPLDETLRDHLVSTVAQRMTATT